MKIEFSKIRFFLSTSLVSLFLFSTSLAFAQSPLCKFSWLLSPILKTSKTIHTDKYIESRLDSKKVSLEEQGSSSITAISETKGQKDLLYLFQKTNNKDWAQFDSAPEIQGDPRMIIEALGPFISKKLGFSFVSEINIQYPSAREFQFRVNQLVKNHSQLKSFFPLQFVATDYSIPRYTYLDMIARHSSLPIGTKGHTLVHDLNWHSLSPGLISPARLRNLQTSLRLFLDFLDFVSQEKWLSQWEHKRIDTHLTRVVERVDLILGSPILWNKSSELYSKYAESLTQIFNHHPFDVLPNTPRLARKFRARNQEDYTASKYLDTNLLDETVTRRKLWIQLITE